MNKIIIKNLRTTCFIGVTEPERTEKQEVLINVVMGVDNNKAGISDIIEDTVDYKKVYLEIINAVENSSFKLLESLAEKIAGLVLKERFVKQVEVKVEKPKALNLAEAAGVEIIRSKNQEL